MPKHGQKAQGLPALHQVAALPVRETNGKLEVCIVTTRETKRWTLPKGWPMKGLKDFNAARVEAEQEAGVVGKPDKRPVGSFQYWKRRDDHFDLIGVTVYLLRVTKILPIWKESTQRQVHWAAPLDAALLVDEPELSSLLMQVANKLI